MKLGFVLLSGHRKPIPSTRVAVLNMLPLLRQAGFQVDILCEPDTPSETPGLPIDLYDRICAGAYDLVVFQKVRGPAVLQLVDRLAATGVKTVYMVCDLIDEVMVRHTTGTIVVTDYLRSLYPPDLAGKIHVVHDGIERPDIVKPAARPVRATKRQPLKAVLVTSAALDTLPVLTAPPAWLDVTIVGAYPPRGRWMDRFNMARWTMATKRRGIEHWRYARFLAHPRIHLEAWHPVGVYSQLIEADVGIIPVDSATWQPDDGILPPTRSVKSENRLTLKMSVGLPVVASPIPAYEAIIEQGGNGFLASTRAQWIDALERLRDPALRQRMGAAARATVHERYSMEEQALRLAGALHSIASAEPQAERAQLARAEEASAHLSRPSDRPASHRLA